MPQVIRPTGLVDPPVEVRPLGEQIDDLMEEVRARAEQGERVLVTTLTKRTAEDLAEYLRDVGLRVKYLHSEIDAIERVEILRGLRGRSSTAWSASTCCAKGSTCPRSRWWPFSTRTRKGSCARRRR